MDATVPSGVRASRIGATLMDAAGSARGPVIRVDAVIVGGGPAGSTCAGALRRHGWDVMVVDRAQFPRDKVCAGWITPEVFPLLDL